MRNPRQQRRHRRTAIVPLLILLASALPLAAQGGGEPEIDPFNRLLAAFDRDFKAALTKPDLAALSLLVAFPLHLNRGRDDVTSIDTPRTLQLRFAEAFPAEVRRAVARTSIGDLVRTDSGFGYGNGEVWVRDVVIGGQERLQVETINLPSRRGDAAPKADWQLAFACTTARHRVMIEVDGKDRGKARYRTWDPPRSLLDKPDFESVGTAGMDGTGACRASVWTFPAGKAVIQVSELGCTDGKEPDGANGELTVSVADEVKESDWCR